MQSNQSRRQRRAAAADGVDHLPASESNQEARPAQSGRLLDDYLTPEELADEFGICLETLKRWHRSGKAPPKVMLGRFPYYSKSTVRAWMQSQERVA
jgi:predicted DNA-binding transcriptional regulator AlpA